MDFLNILDIHFICSVIVIFSVFLLFNRAGIKREKSIILKIENCLKQFEKTEHQINLVLNELRNINRRGVDFGSEKINRNPEEYPDAGYDYEMEDNDTKNQNKLYVGNIDYSATEAELAEHFAKFGQIEFVNIPINRYNGRARGFGFVTFGSVVDAERAIALNGSEFRGRQIQVNFAKERD